MPRPNSSGGAPHRHQDHHLKEKKMSSSTASHTPVGHVVADVLRSIAVRVDRPVVAKPAKVAKVKAPNAVRINYKKMARRGVTEDGGYARPSFLSNQSGITDHTSRLQNFR
jgi:hypothetical protein